MMLSRELLRQMLNQEYLSIRTEVADLILAAYLSKCTRMWNFADVVYDKSVMYPARLACGEVIIKFGQENAWMLLPDSMWTSTEHGRTVYMLAAAAHLPELEPDLLRAVPKLYPHEQHAVMDWVPVAGCA